MGTNTGLFMTPDRGATWQQLSSGGSLAATDFTSLEVAPGRMDRMYVASDGGGSDQGGLWVSSDAGGHFASLQPPLPEVTSLAVSSDATPTLVVATFRPADHAVAVWTYRDAGGPPQGPTPVAPPVPSTTQAHNVAAPISGGARWLALVSQPESPYLAGGVVAAVVMLLATVAYLRRGGQP